MKKQDLFLWERVLLARRRQTALNILKNHFEEALSLNKRFPLFERPNKPGLRVEDFLFEAASSKTLLLHSRAVSHFRKVVESWPTGTVAWEHLPPERNPYQQSERFADFRTLSHEELAVKELISENRDLLLQTIAQGRAAAKLGLTRDACETTDDVLRATWLLGFERGEKELQAAQSAKEQLDQESEKQP